MPLPTTFAGESSRGEGQWSFPAGGGGVPSTNSWFAYQRDPNVNTTSGISGTVGGSNSANLNMDSALGVAVDANGNVYSVGRGQFAGTAGYSNNTWAYITKYNTEGVLQFSKKIGYNSLNAYATGVVVGPVTGNIYVSAVIGYLSGGQQVYLFSFSPSGTVNWVQSRGTSSTAGLDGNPCYNMTMAPGCLAVDSSENLYLGINPTHPSSSNRYFPMVISFNSSGTLRWAQDLGSNYAGGTDNLYLTNMCYFVYGGGTTPALFLSYVDGTGKVFQKIIETTAGSAETSFVQNIWSTGSFEQYDAWPILGSNYGDASLSTSTFAGAPIVFTDGNWIYQFINDQTGNKVWYQIYACSNGSPYYQGSTQMPYFQLNNGTTIAALPVTCGVATSAGNFVLGFLGTPNIPNASYARFTWNGSSFNTISDGPSFANTLVLNTTCNYGGFYNILGGYGPDAGMVAMTTDTYGNIYMAGAIPSGMSYQYSTTSGSGKSATTLNYSYASMDAFILKWRQANTATSSSAYSHDTSAGSSNNFGITWYTGNKINFGVSGTFSQLGNSSGYGGIPLYDKAEYYTLVDALTVGADSFNSYSGTNYPYFFINNKISIT